MSKRFDAREPKEESRQAEKAPMPVRICVESNVVQIDPGI